MSWNTIVQYMKCIQIIENFSNKLLYFTIKI